MIEIIPEETAASKVEAVLKESIHESSYFTAVFFWIFKKKIISLAEFSDSPDTSRPKRSPFIYDLR
tara:strand:- start:1365 stop:1562 length:198 start_codon:yes stop_codon:yes gene_type:complete